MRYKVWTLCQPWATGMIFGPKRIENRPRPDSYRGLVVVHAGKSQEWFSEEACADLRKHWAAFPSRVKALSMLPFSCAIGTFEIVDCKPIAHADVEDRPFAWGPHCFLTQNPRFFHKPVALRGMQGLFVPPSSTDRRALEEAIAASSPISDWKGDPLGVVRAVSGALYA